MLVSVRPYRPVGAHAKQTLNGIFTPTKPSGVDGLLIQSLGANSRFVLDGSPPDATTGYQILDGAAPLLIPVGDNTVIKIVNESGSPVLQYQWVRQV